MRLRLLTIGPSHYCEKARWALDRVGATYKEERHPPLLHWASTLPRGGRRTVPILITPHGTLGDSTDILRHLDQWIDEPVRLYPSGAMGDEAAALEERFDVGLGVATRRWAYCWLVDIPHAFPGRFEEGVAPLEAAIFRAGANGVRGALRRAFKVSERAKARMLEEIRTLFAELDDRLKDGRPFLQGDRFTAADLTLASLASPALFPDGFSITYPPLAALPEAMAADIRALRATRTGAFVQRLYDQERRRVVKS